MMEKFRISAKIPVDSKTLFNDWLSSKEHTAFTGGSAKIENKVNGAFSAWDGYITGRTTVIEPYSKIVQKWRTMEFQDDSQDSILEIQFEEISDSETRIILHHQRIPNGQGNKYKQGWREHYFEPMIEYYKGKQEARY
jgi:activator of HSP90 ATPase